MPPSIRLFHIYRIAALAVSFLGTVVNFVVAAQLLTLWHSYKWEAENSEWEWLGDRWRVLGVKVVWALLSSYFASAAAISALGLAGVIKVCVFCPLSFSGDLNYSFFNRITHPSFAFTAIILSQILHFAPPLRSSSSMLRFSLQRGLAFARSFQGIPSLYGIYKKWE